jgi:hypothetical protein
MVKSSGPPSFPRRRNRDPFQPCGYALCVTTIGDIIREELPAFLERTGQERFHVLEIGVLRAQDEEHEKGDGHSTLAFAELCSRYPGSTFTGIDLMVSDAIDAVGKLGFGDLCTFLQGDSLEMLKTLVASGRVFNVIYLDADNSSKSTMAEYELALQVLDRPGLILGDDMNLDHPEVRKGRILIPHLRDSGTPFRLLQRHTPWDVRDILVQEVA